ncbi:MAG: DNA primase [Hydrotalea sp.]|nr:DNA primase [Hydrotalea sp.]
MISPQSIQEIKNRIDILDIVGEFVKLKKRGTNYLGLCPFHNEKTPSFTVSANKEIYKCFGCGKSGNSITFLMEHEKLSYVEALKWLAQRYNIAIEETETNPEYQLQQQAADSLYIINKFTQQYYSEQLFQTDEGKNIGLGYLLERGFSEEILRKFQVGYHPNARTILAETLTAQQFSRDLLIKSGLVVERNGELVDNYRGRIIFPVHHISGKVIGFGARVIGSNDRGPKYINTPENELYVKGKLLYGTYFARTAIAQLNECLLVEGYTDVMGLHQAGVEHVVASGGTALTPDQLRLIKKYTPNLTILYDGDAAGIKAALRGLDLAIEEGLHVNLVLLPEQEDPDSYVRKYGGEALKEFIQKNKKDFILFQLEVLLREAGSDANKKNAVVNTIAETLSRITRAEDFTLLENYVKRCSSLLQIDEGGLTHLVNTYKRKKITKSESKLSVEEAGQLQEQVKTAVYKEDNLIQHDQLVERNLVRVLLEYGLEQWNEEKTNAQYIFEELSHFDVDEPEVAQILEFYREAYINGEQPNTKMFLYHAEEWVRNLVVSATIFPYEVSDRWEEKMEGLRLVDPKDIPKKDVFVSMQYFKLRKIKRMLEQNQIDLEQAKDPDLQMRIIGIHKELKQQERNLTQELGSVIVK